MASIMLMPRSYQYTSPTKASSRSPSPKARGKMASMKSIGSEGKSLIDEKWNEPEHSKGQKSRGLNGKPVRISSIAHSTPSQPVIIPTRTATPKAHRGTRPSEPRKTSDEQHDPNALSPSMAALTAITSGPKSGARAIKHDHRQRLMRGGFRKTLSSTSPQSWSILQSPPSPTEAEGEADQDKETDTEIEVGSMASQSTLADRISMYRSLSADSIPSLDVEGGVFYSPDSLPMPRTPHSRRAGSPRMKAKLLATSEPLADGEVHPLSVAHSMAEDHQGQDSSDAGSDGSSQLEIDVSKSRTTARCAEPQSNFKSNLTASLQRLKSAALSMSIPTPSVSSVLAINSKFIADKRSDPPRPKSPLPLNNPAFSDKTLSTLVRRGETKQLLAQDLFFSSTPGEEYRPISSSVQLQEYLRPVPAGDPLLDRATAPPIFAAASPPPPILLPGVDSPRPREPRENSNFLRMVVLEMNMRRAGKLGDVNGRARIWIAPRPEKAVNADLPKAEATKDPATISRAERGMSEEVGKEIAEAMLETKQDVCTQSRDTSFAEPLAPAPIATCKTPHRWISWTPESLA